MTTVETTTRYGFSVIYAGSIGPMLLVGDRLIGWVYRSRCCAALIVFGWGLSVIDARHEDSPFPIGKHDRPGIWVGLFFVQAIHPWRAP